MRKYENQCVECPPWMGCNESVCPYANVAIDYCDQCGVDGAKYRINGDDYCEDCANEYLQEVFDDLTTSEKADILNIDLFTIE